jgi:tetratricopeptide (TPR) repeat protein
MDRFSAHMDRAWELIVLGKTLPALVAAKKALDADRQSPEAHNLLGYIHAMNGDVEEALLSYQQAMELDEEYIDPVLNTAELLSHPDANPEEAIRLCRSAAHLVSNPEELVETILLEVEALLNLGRAEEARGRLDDIDERASLSTAHALLLGRAFYEASDPKSAAHCIDHVLESDPENADALYYRGLIARDQGKRIEAVAAFVKVREKDLEDTAPPWGEHFEPLDGLIGRAIASLEESIQAVLRGTEIIVQAFPSEAQILSELDPRQVVFAQTVDPYKKRFEKLWIFQGNMVRVGIMPNTAENDLAQMIEREVMSGRGVLC